MYLYLIYTGMRCRLRVVKIRNKNKLTCIIAVGESVVEHADDLGGCIHILIKTLQ